MLHTRLASSSPALARCLASRMITTAAAVIAPRHALAVACAPSSAPRRHFHPAPPPALLAATPTASSAAAASATPATPAAANADTLPDLDSFDSEDPKEIAKRLLAEEDARRDHNKSEWRSYMLTNVALWGGATVLVVVLGSGFSNPFDPNAASVSHKGWTLMGPITPSTPSWLVTLRSHIPAIVAHTTPKEREAAWLKQLASQNEVEQALEAKFREQNPTGPRVKEAFGGGRTAGALAMQGAEIALEEAQALVRKERAAAGIIEAPRR